MEHSRILVTSALPYANGAIHFGHLAGAYLPADMYVRYQRLRSRDVLFICGSDEHGVSILISARKEGVAPQDIIDRYHELNKRAFERIGMSFDNYSRTSLPVHHETAREWFSEFRDKGVLTRSEEKQLFDPEAMMFLPDRFVIGTCPHCGYERAYGDQCENCSTYYDQTELRNPRSLLSEATPEIRVASHWHFPLGAYQERLERYIEEHADVWKENVLQQVRSWLKQGLSDRPISRDMEWGVKVPGEEEDGKVIYVWFEAVLGYLSASKEWAARIGQPEKWKDYWCDPSTRYVPFIGKDNIVFHCLMFPAMLMEKGGYVLPENVPANEFLNLEGRKFSKSQGWSIELNEFLDTYPADPLRYTLAMNMPEMRDSDFYWKDFQARNNNELADILGNLVNRAMHFAEKFFDGRVPAMGEAGEDDRNFLAQFETSAARIAEAYERFRFRDGVTATMNLARAVNKYFNDKEPWKAIKTDPRSCATAINCSLQSLYALSVLIEPVLPFTAQTLRTMLEVNDPAAIAWDAVGHWRLPDGHVLGPRRILFEKIPDEAIDLEIAKLGRLTTEVDKTYPPLKEQISIDEFMKVDLRVGTVLEAEAVPKSSKLLKLRVDIGSEQRQLVAGIALKYTPEQLIGKRIVIVANLKPAKLFGIESQGMILAASLEEEGPVVICPEDVISIGAIVK